MGDLIQIEVQALMFDSADFDELATGEKIRTNEEV